MIDLDTKSVAIRSFPRDFFIREGGLLINEDSRSYACQRNSYPAIAIFSTRPHKHSGVLGLLQHLQGTFALLFSEYN